jgi:nitrogen fixation protein FixH
VDPINDPIEARPRTGRAWLWPLGVVGALAMSLTVCGITVMAAVSDPSYAIEDDYYQKAVDWDRQRALEAASDALGWEAIVDFDLNASTIAVTLVNDEGVPLEGAIVRAMTFHHARRSEAQDVTFSADGPGRYVAVLDRPREGQWQIRLRATRSGDTFLHTRDVFATPSSTPRSDAA